MKRVLYVLVGVLLGGAAFGGVALATGSDGKGESVPAGAETITAQAPNARLAVYIDGSSTAGVFTIARAKGVISVSNPGPGEYCIRTVTSVTPSKVVPNVSTVFNGTSGYDAFAQWNSARTSCPSGNIQVNTFDSGTGGLLNDVAFTVTVD